MRVMVVAAAPSSYWFITRASGAMALVLLTGSVALGVASVRRMEVANLRFVVGALHRSVSLLAVVFVLEILGAINLDWPPALNVLALLGGLALVLVAFGMLNVSRGRRFFSVPQKLGVPELTAFVLLPVVLPLVFGGQLTSATGYDTTRYA